MGLINAVVPLARLERETLRWSRRMGRVALPRPPALPAAAERATHGCRGPPLAQSRPLGLRGEASPLGCRGEAAAVP